MLPPFQSIYIYFYHGSSHNTLAPSSKVFFPLQLLHFLRKFDCSAMASNFTVGESSGKRKMKEVEVVFPEPALQLSPTSKKMRILNGAGPFRSMMTLNQEDREKSLTLSNNIKKQTQKIDQIIDNHNESLKQALLSVLCEKRLSHRLSEENSAKRLKQMEEEIEFKTMENNYLKEKIEQYKAEGERYLQRVRYLERLTASLREKLEDVTEHRHLIESGRAESETDSFVNTDRVALVKLDCQVCKKNVATVMMWPCRHVCACKRCEKVTPKCPVCREVKNKSIYIRLPCDAVQTENSL